MIRLYRAPLKNSVRQWRASANHPASSEIAVLMQPDLVAGPYVLLADAMTPPRYRSA